MAVHSSGFDYHIIYVYPWYFNLSFPWHTSLISISPALVALRVNALHGGRKGVRRILIVSGIIYIISCIGIAIAATLPSFPTGTWLL
jgi:hypothetical protein